MQEDNPSRALVAAGASHRDVAVRVCEGVNPASTYARPFDVLCDLTLNEAEKIDLLRRWLACERGPDGRTATASDIERALKFLGATV